ncbi:hypothetical protein ACJX0J_019223 [Zea mays]
MINNRKLESSVKVAIWHLGISEEQGELFVGIKGNTMIYELKWEAQIIPKELGGAYKFFMDVSHLVIYFPINYCMLLCITFIYYKCLGSFTSSNRRQDHGGHLAGDGDRVAEICVLLYCVPDIERVRFQIEGIDSFFYHNPRDIGKDYKFLGKILVFIISTPLMPKPTAVMHGADHDIIMLGGLEIFDSSILFVLKTLFEIMLFEDLITACLLFLFVFFAFLQIRHNLLGSFCCFVCDGQLIFLSK